MKSLKAFCAESHLPESFIRATVKQAGGWDSFREMAADVTNHGADGGFHGFIYYTDTVRFAERNQESLLQACRDMASDLGEGGAYSLIAGFNCLKSDADTVADAINSKRYEDHDTVMNALAWFALEEVSRAYADMVQ